MDIMLNETMLVAIKIARDIARINGHEMYSPAHLLRAVIYKEIGLHDFLRCLNKDLAYIEEWAEIRIEDYPKVLLNAEIVPDDKIDVVIQQADIVRLKLGLLEINPICILTALAKPGIGFTTNQLKSFPIREKEIFDLYTPEFSGNTENEAAGNATKHNSTSSSLNKFCINQTQTARNKIAPPVIGREGELRQMMEILGRKNKPNVLIIGESGVGKTALVNGLIAMIVNDDVPSYLKNANIFELDTGSLIAGATYKGEIEDRTKNIINEIKNQGNAILFIDEIHSLLDVNSGNNGAGSILKQELSKNELTLIGTTSNDAYRKLVEPDFTFNRKFEAIALEEPDDELALKMVLAIVPGHEDFHQIKVSPTAAKESVRLSKRYIKDRHLPDAALDLIDRTLSSVKIINETSALQIKKFLSELEVIQIMAGQSDEPENFRKLQLLQANLKIELSPVLLGMLNSDKDINTIENFSDLSSFLGQNLHFLQNLTQKKIEEITEQEIAAIISNKTGIPIGKLQSGEKERLLNMETRLKSRVVGQDQALKVLCDAILESRSGMNKAGQPIGSFFFLGPTGTGKTELAKALAESLFNDEKAMIRFDMSEFKEEHSAALLYGAPPGYVGYQEGGLLVNKIRQHPYCVVLFDEIEKAHSSVYDIFLQIMDEGKIHDRQGKEGDFSNAIVIFTSNIGSEWITGQIEKGKTPSGNEMMEIMGNYFRPEFLARISEIVPFVPINENILLKIFDIQLSYLKNILQNKGIELSLTEKARKTLAFKGFTPKYGARQIVGVIRNYLRRPISKMIISNKLQCGNCLTVDIDANNELEWIVVE